MAPERLGGAGGWACAIALSASLLGCHWRPFWKCTDPEPVLRGLALPPEAWLVHDSGPGLFDGRCSVTAERTLGTIAGELRTTEAMSEELERAGFTRVGARADSAFWCARRLRFHQFTRGDLLLRFAVEPIPFDDGNGGVVPRGAARYAIFMAMRNFDQDRAVDCASR